MKISLLDGIKFRLWAVFHSCVIKRPCALNLTTLTTKFTSTRKANLESSINLTSMSVDFWKQE